MTVQYTYDGKITLEIGCMYAEKTSAILRALQRNSIAKKKCLFIKHSIDTRYGGKNVNHAGHEYTGFDVVSCDRLSSLDSELWYAYDVIGVDELQFFDDPLTLVEWANLGKTIFAAGLDAKSDLTEFGRLHELIPHCEKVHKNTAVCVKCGHDASFSKRIVEDKRDILVGGKESYIAVCRRCYHM